MAVDDPSPPPSESPPASKRRLRWSNPFLVLGLMIAGFFAVSLYGGIVAYYNLTIDAAHAYDLSIFQQAFSSTVHGYHVPFYESTDCIMKGRCSFLIVHPSFILYPLAPIYAAFPSPITLFALRSFVVALAALPLFWLTRQVTRSDGKALLAAGMFLLWAPTLSGDLYSFHVESFIPLELFTMIALWQAGRYRLGLLAAGTAFITLEAAPVFVFLIGAFFLFPEVETAFRVGWGRWKSDRGRPGRWSTAMRGLIASARGSLRRVDVRCTVALMIGSILAYIAVNLFLNVFGAGLLGIPSPVIPGGLQGVFFNNSQNGTTGNLSALVASPAFVASIEYWLILYALVGFLPLLNLRSFVIVAVPWIGYSLFNIVHRFTTLSSQYTMLAAVPVFLGLAYALAQVDFHRKILPVRAPKSAPAPVPEPTPPPIHRPRRRRRVTAAWVAVFGLVIVANLIINPMVPLIPDTVGTPHGPFGPFYFEPWLTVQPGFAWVERLVALIPPNETVVVPYDLFPLVANNIYAYRLSANPPNLTGLSFNISAEPDWVLVTPALVNSGGRTLAAELPNESIYQLRGYVATSTVGPILLYERGYVGPPELFGPQAVAPSNSWTPAQGLAVEHSGRLVINPSAPGGAVIETNESLNKTGLVCSAQAGFLPPGTYSLSADLTRLPSGQNLSGTTRVLDIRLMHFGGLLWETNVTVAQLPVSQWTSLEFNLTTPAPAVNAEIDLEWADVDVPFAVASVALDADG